MPWIKTQGEDKVSERLQMLGVSQIDTGTWDCEYQGLRRLYLQHGIRNRAATSANDSSGSLSDASCPSMLDSTPRVSLRAATSYPEAIVYTFHHADQDRRNLVTEHDTRSQAPCDVTSLADIPTSTPNPAHMHLCINITPHSLITYIHLISQA